MNENKEACDLCGLIIEVHDFHLSTTEGEKSFCCEGCQGIYQMLHEDVVLAKPEEEPSQ